MVFITEFVKIYFIISELSNASALKTAKFRQVYFQTHK